MVIGVILTQVVAELPHVVTSLRQAEKEEIITNYRNNKKQNGALVDEALMVATMELIQVDPVVLATRFITSGDGSSWLCVRAAQVERLNHTADWPNSADWVLLRTELAAFSPRWN